MGRGKGKKRSIADAAKMMDVSKRSLERMLYVSHRAPGLGRLIWDGKIKVSFAEKVVRGFIKACEANDEEWAAWFCVKLADKAGISDEVAWRLLTTDQDTSPAGNLSDGELSLLFGK